MKKFLSVLVLALVGLSCENTNVAGTEIGNARDIDVIVVGFDGSVAKLAARQLSSGASITNARVVLEGLEFKTLEECASDVDDNEISFDGPFVADLLLGTSKPDLGTAKIPANTYCRIELKMAKLDPEEVPAGVSAGDAIVGHSFYVEGERGDGTPFVAKLEQDEEFRLESVTGFDLTNPDLKTLFIAFDLNAWLSGVDLDGALVSGDGTILIDKDNNTTLLDQIKTNIQTSAKLFGDQNDDGSLEDSEADDDDVLASGED